MAVDMQSAGEGELIRPVQRAAPLRQAVYESMVELVVSGRLNPGEHLVETDLARQLGVSRQPVREALHRLQAEGWVDLRPNQGAFVHEPTDNEVDQLLDARELLEVETARLAARSADAEAAARLRAICHEGEAAVKAGDTEVFITAKKAKEGVTFQNTGTEPFVSLRYFGPDVHSSLPAVGDYLKGR